MRVPHLLAVLAAAFGLAGCSTTPAVTLQSVGQSPAGSVSPGIATVPVGIVLGFRVTANSSSVVTAAVDDPGLATVAPTTQTSEFVIIGLAAGQTTLHVFVDSHESTELPVQVTPPAP